jgi:hypothetical protein
MTIAKAMAIADIPLVKATLRIIPLLLLDWFDAGGDLTVAFGFPSLGHLNSLTYK